MEERLDDAINVLRNHAESQVALHLGPVGPHGGIYSHTSPPQLEHLVRISTNRSSERLRAISVHSVLCYALCLFQASPHPAVTVAQPQGSYPGLTPTPDTDGSIKIERLPVSNASKSSPSMLTAPRRVQRDAICNVEETDSPIRLPFLASSPSSRCLLRRPLISLRYSKSANESRDRNVGRRRAAVASSSDHFPPRIAYRVWIEGKNGKEFPGVLRATGALARPTE